MIKEIILLSFIYITAIIFNLNLAPTIIESIGSFYYNNIIISALILVQIDNFSLYYDLTKKIEKETNHSNIEDKYLKTILKQIDYINKREKDFNRKIVRFKENFNKINRSCNDLYNIC